MFLDLFISLAARCSPHLRRMGYLDEAVAMRRRHRRRGAAWQPHLDKSRRFILSSAEKCRTRNKAVVLGSGLLLDLPLAQLASLFKQVVLMDVVCLPEARKEIRRYHNVTFIERDVTDLAERLYKNRTRGIFELPHPAPCSRLHDDRADLVVSLNILSQLWVVPRSYVTAPLPWAAEEELSDWRRCIVESHYAALRSLRCDVCLVADYEFVTLDREGGTISNGSTVGGLELPPADETWSWNIEPIQDGSQFHSRELKVGAWHFARPVSRRTSSPNGSIGDMILS